MPRSSPPKRESKRATKRADQADVTAPTPRKDGPKPMTKRRMENIAKFHVERFATTAIHLTRVLLRRAERARRIHGGENSEFKEWAEDIVSRFVRGGIVNDARYASGRAAALRTLGKSPGKIRLLLRAKGVDRSIIDKVVAEGAISESGGDAAFEAALAYAMRRRLGPYGKDFETDDADARRKRMRKDLSALARAGFSYDIAKRVLAKPPE